MLCGFIQKDYIETLDALVRTTDVDTIHHQPTMRQRPHEPAAPPNAYMLPVPLLTSTR